MLNKKKNNKFATLTIVADWAYGLIFTFLDKNMKVVFIIKSFAMKAGVERLMSDKMNYMAEHGHIVTLITYEQGTHSEPFSLNESIKHVDLDTRFFILKKHKLYRRIIEHRRLRQTFKKRLQQVIDDLQPDIINITTYSINLIGIIINLRCRAKKTIESHVSFDSILKEDDYKGKGILHIIARYYDAYLFNKLKNFDALFALTNGDALHWEKYVKTVHVIPNPLTTYPEHVKEHHETHHRIICAGRLDYQKGYDLLIEAFSLIADKCPKWHIDIFGSGEEERALCKMISQKGLEERISIHPATDHIYEEYQNSDFLVFSSRYEGWGLVLVEAMACGIPTVSFRCNYGPEEIVTNDVDGLLVKNGDIQELSDKIFWMITHPQQREKMGVNARIAVSKYKKEPIFQKWLTILNDLIEKS